MIEYKRLSDVNNQPELDYIIDEWKDRFAKSPEPVENLIKLINGGHKICVTRSKYSLTYTGNDQIVVI